MVGISTLGAEIAAARLMAPFFGASTIVWANTIGVVLVALSIGYWLGGRLGDRYPSRRSLCLAVLGAAVLLALVPLVAQPFFEISVNALDEIEAGAFVGSLFAVLALIAIPVGLAGTCSPWAIRLAVPDVEHSGRVAGRLYAISTVGSLLGTMLAALVLIPLVGTQRTFLVFALLLAIVAAAGLGWRAAAAPVAVAAAMAIPVGTVKATDEGTVIFETDSEHQYIRVIEQPDGDRALELNEGQATHSLYRPGSFLTGDVWDGYLVPPFTALDRAPERIAILGNAAGTTARAYGHYFPETEVDGVEIDPELERVGLEYFDMGSNREPVGPQRGRPAVAASLRGRLRRDHGRRLPPALHPVLSRNERVLRARSRPARPGRRGGRQRRPSGGQRRPREGALGDDGGGVPERPTRPDRAHQHAPDRHRRPGLRREPDAGGARVPARAACRGARSRRRGSAPRCPAAPSTPTTRRRSSG